MNTYEFSMPNPVLNSTKKQYNHEYKRIDWYRRYILAPQKKNRHETIVGNNVLHTYESISIV
jgi:hypothetical protein